MSNPVSSALYVHWPFCLAKCPYCDFNSHVRGGIDIAHWQAALLADLQYEAARAPTKKLTSIFFGGGTPSLMPPVLVEAILREAECLWGFAPNIEITLEANPSSVEASKFAALGQAGINRVSLGIQSLHDDALHFLGRLHNAQEALQAIALAQDSFRRVSIDLIYARPGQTERAWRDELARALAFGTGHVSLYQLTIEPGTRFATEVRTGRMSPLGNDEAAELFALTRETAATAGLPAYEISNHARAGEESRHNLTYWRYGDYAGVGPGAHGRIAGMATVRHRKPENYLAAVARQGHGLDEERRLSATEQAAEALLMGLRLTEGIDLPTLETRFGFPRSFLLNLDKMEFYEDEGLVWNEGNRVGLTERGMPLLDGLLAELVALEGEPA